MLGKSGEKPLDYDKMAEEAMRGVVKQAMEFVTKKGLPGNHHFYITFRTRYPGVVMPEYLRGRHPLDITIVLQHQFWGLEVFDDHFEVNLNFNKCPERLSIPFKAVEAFADPSVKFGLQFQIEELPESQLIPLPVSEKPKLEEVKTQPIHNTNNVIALDAFRKK